MSDTAEQFDAFAYQAQTADGQALSGTIDARDASQASQLLHGMRLRVLQIEPVRTAARTKPMRGDDFLAFNQQLSHLTAAGLPVEHGLKLIAQDMRDGRLAETVRQVAAEMERGVPLDQAFEKQRGAFPPLYAKLIAAGVASNNLPGMLLNLGRHMELVYRLRAALWRAAAYPLMVMIALALIVIFMGLTVIPQFEMIFKDFGTKLPFITELLLQLPKAIPAFVIVLLLILIGVPLIWKALQASGADQRVIDTLILPLPLIGTILKRNLVARWCDALKLGVQAGLDLPRAIALAGEAVGSPSLRKDGHDLSGALSSGIPLDAVAGSMRLLPATVPAAISLAGQHHDLAATLGTLSEMYQQQAETRLAVVPGLLTPVLIAIVAAVIGLVIAGLFMPFISLIRAISGG